MKRLSSLVLLSLLSLNLMAKGHDSYEFRCISGLKDLSTGERVKRFTATLEDQEIGKLDNYVVSVAIEKSDIVEDSIVVKLVDQESKKLISFASPLSRIFFQNRTNGNFQGSDLLCTGPLEILLEE